jgi:hypothetical protein
VREREVTDKRKGVRRYKRSKRIRTSKDDEDKSCLAEIMPHGIVTLLALVGSGVIGLSVGAWLGLFVEGD